MSNRKAEYDRATLELIQRLLNGETVSGLAHELGLTRQAVDQRLRRYLGTETFKVVARESYRRREAANADDIERRRQENLWRPPQSSNTPVRQTDEELLEALRRWEKRYGAPVSVRRVVATSTDEREGCPTPAIYYRRFGTWIEACRRAGVSSGETRRQEYVRTWPTDRVVEVLAEFARARIAAGRRPSTNAYVAWHEARLDTTPSIATVRNRGAWSYMISQALQTLIEENSERAD